MALRLRTRRQQAVACCSAAAGLALLLLGMHVTRHAPWGGMQPMPFPDHDESGSAALGNSLEDAMATTQRDRALDDRVKKLVRYRVRAAPSCLVRPAPVPQTLALTPPHPNPWASLQLLLQLPGLEGRHGGWAGRSTGAGPASTWTQAGCTLGGAPHPNARRPPTSHPHTPATPRPHPLLHAPRFVHTLRQAGHQATCRNDPTLPLEPAIRENIFIGGARAGLGGGRGRAAGESRAGARRGHEEHIHWWGWTLLP
jgi:hypothetical protein